MDDVPRVFTISDIQSFPFGDERSSVASCARSSMIYGSETMPLLVSRLRWYGHVMRKCDEDWVK